VRGYFGGGSVEELHLLRSQHAEEEKSGIPIIVGAIRFEGKSVIPRKGKGGGVVWFLPLSAFGRGKKRQFCDRDFYRSRKREKFGEGGKE